ncbi:MAG: peptidoglycan-N-acetylglucosamine deacetylase [Clostridiales bacterium]|nr:peptidoglycan-N-acetylglucosamine deacetylase [Clostridiales bacterium]MDK2902587.1 peptidoglycan-N-acetylglucosamine deacetylase [Clostridiales bacterium]
MRIIIIKRQVLIQIAVILVLIAVVLLILHQTGTIALGVFFAANRELPIYSVDVPDKRIAISFDASWGAEQTDQLLKVLKERNIKTTFFLVGIWIDKYPDKVKAIANDGHEIGNHSNTHPHMNKLSEQQIRDELDKVSQKIAVLTGKKTTLFRPPFGEYNDKVVRTARAAGYEVIQWDVDSLDWKNYGVEDEVDRVLKKVRNGSIVLFHNDAEYTPQALPIILDKLIQDGYKIVPVSELIYPPPYYIDHTGRQFKSGDTDK